jgi:hypothetical protein
MPFPLIEIPGSPRITSLTAAIRREILSVLAGSDTVTVPSATAQIAASWSARRRRRGASPSDVRTAVEIVFQVGADLVDEVAAQPAPDHGPTQQSEILGRRRTLVRYPRKAA